MTKKASVSIVNSASRVCVHRGRPVRRGRRVSRRPGEVSEWSKEAVLKTVEPLCGSGGSNPSLSAHLLAAKNPRGTAAPWSHSRENS